MAGMVAKQQMVQNLLLKYKDLYESPSFKEKEFHLGIDEAGRGPVLGSMVYSALWWPKELEPELSVLGFQDSKALTEQTRDRLLGLIGLLRNKIIFYEVEELSADLISNNMLSDSHSINLNQMSHRAAINLTRSALKQGFNVTKIVVDTVGDPGKYRSLIIQSLEKEYGHVFKEVIVQPKADRDHKVVSASSICAKVTRDRIITNWQFKQNLPFEGQLGSGYPGDPKTKEWLKNNKHPIFGFPDLVRFSWATTTNLLQSEMMVKIKEKEYESNLRKVNIFKNKKALAEDIWDIC